MTLSLSNVLMVGLLLLFICAVGGLLDSAEAGECEPGTRLGPVVCSESGRWMNDPLQRAAPVPVPTVTAEKPMTRLPSVIDLDGWAGVDVIYGGQRIHLSREQLGHWAFILSHTCDPAVVGNCTAMGMPDHELRKSKESKP